MQRIRLILLNILPIALMVALIPIVKNDLLLTALYVIVIAFSFALKQYKKDIVVFVFGFIIMTASEYIFLQSGAETFNRNSLFGIMPLWLPFLWGYGFVVIKRSTLLLVGVDPSAHFGYNTRMEENYVQIYCSFVADILEQSKITEEEMAILIQEFAKVAESIHSREDLLQFLHEFRDYPELQPLKMQLEDKNHVFIFKSIEE